MGIPPTNNPNVPERAIAALHQGNKIEAIKIIRETNGASLKDAKDLVESFIEGRPDLKAKFIESNSASVRGCVLFIAFILAAIASAFFIYSKKS